MQAERCFLDDVAAFVHANRFILTVVFLVTLTITLSMDYRQCGFPFNMDVGSIACSVRDDDHTNDDLYTASFVYNVAFVLLAFTLLFVMLRNTKRVGYMI
jgi:hypothetical protein|uniref:Uncharacterized protein n=1 Tax=viral metagenome TaxID=1070528 RepID=A0A6C0IUK4_9ZZZZ